MASSAAAARLRRVTRRISELQAEQRTLIAQIGLGDTEEKVILEVLALTADVHAFLDRVGRNPTDMQRRRGVTLSRRLNRASVRLERLSDSDGKAAAVAAAEEATQRLLVEMFRA